MLTKISKRNKLGALGSSIIYQLSTLDQQLKPHYFEFEHIAHDVIQLYQWKLNDPTSFKSFIHTKCGQNELTNLQCLVHHNETRLINNYTFLNNNQYQALNDIKLIINDLK